MSLRSGWSSIEKAQLSACNMSVHLFYFIVIFVISVSAQTSCSDTWQLTSSSVPCVYTYFQTSASNDCSGTTTCYRIESGWDTICAPWSSTTGKETISASINTNYGKLNFRSSSCGYQSETDQNDGTWDQCAATDFFDTGRTHSAASELAVARSNAKRARSSSVRAFLHRCCLHRAPFACGHIMLLLATSLPTDGQNLVSWSNLAARGTVLS